MTNIDCIKHLDKIAIVIVGFNRLDSIKRLLSSLEQAHYPSKDIPLVISIDASGDEALYDFVRNYQWKNGVFYPIIREKRLGLKEHIFTCGDLTQYFKGIILLEDDLFVSPYFYFYTLATLDYYQDDDLAACIGLYTYRSNIYSALPFEAYQGEFDVFGTQATVTWGECWNRRMWSDFRQWLKDNPNIDWKKLDIAQSIKNFKRAWSKFFSAYLSVTGRFVVVPYKSYTTNFSESGEHNDESSSKVQVPIVYKKETLAYAPVSKLVRYDSYFDPVDINGLLPVPCDNVYIDLYGNRPNIKLKRYLLSVDILPYDCIKSYALALRPIDSNIRHNISGRGIYLYDLHSPVKRKKDIQPIQSIQYRLVMFRPSLLLKFVKYYIIRKVREKLHV